MRHTKANADGGGLFVVDNSDKEWKVLRYLQDWADIANRFDIATGMFEIGGLLGLDGKWQQLEKVRILMGGEVTARTRRALLGGLTAAVSRTLGSPPPHRHKPTGALRTVRGNT